MQNITQAVGKSLLTGKRTRRRLPGGGRLQIERPAPMIVVHRRRTDVADRATDKLLAHASSALIVGEEDRVDDLLEMIVQHGVESFGGFLILEIWAGPEPESGQPPRFVVYGPKRAALIPLVQSLQHELCGIELDGRAVEVVVQRGLPPAPPGCDPLLTESEARDHKCIRFGLEIPPAHRDPATGDAWPQILRSLRRDLTQAFRRWAYQFLHGWTTLRPAHYNVLGSRTIARAVWQVDQQLAAVADSFDFLLQATPVNSAEAWQDFKASKFQETPVLQYRPVPVEPTLLKRALFAVPIEKVDDPALYQLFREKQDELDRQITLLLDMNTPRFVHGSIQLFGGVDDELYRVARRMLEQMPPTIREKADEPALDARAFAARAEAEVASFRKQWPEIKATVQVREDICTGLMVSHGSLLIGASTSIPASRAEALIQHEVGTHVLTYWNGRAQPFRQLYSGLAGYDPLQEGIAVLAEAIVGGLNPPRKRLLLGRVVAARLMIDGASFVDTFRELHDTWSFPARTAFTITLRIYRGGGLTKDAVYVRGIGQLLDYLRGGGELEPLLVGKIAVEHVPLIQELQAREILVPPPLRPGFLDSPLIEQQMSQIRSGLTLFQMLRDEAKPAGL
jgi:uncharacterized protein (TIGR02421 family)